MQNRTKFLSATPEPFTSMRENSDKQRIHQFMELLGRKVNSPVDVYFTGGVTTVLFDIREMTLDINVKFEPDSGDVYTAIKEIKQELNMNIELAAPDQFLPPLPGWQSRSIFITSVGKASFYHYDIYSQILSKLERSWSKDLSDAKGLYRKNVDIDKLTDLFYSTEKDYDKYPGVDFKELEKKLIQFRNEVLG